MQSALQNAIAHSDVPALTSTLISRVSSASTPQEFLEDLSLAFRESSSPYISNIASKFTQEVSSLSSIAATTGKVPSFGSIDLRNEFKQRITSRSLNISQLPESMASSIQSISTKLGGARYSILHQKRADLPGAEQLVVRFKGGSLKDARGKNLTLKLPVPLTGNRGYFFRGATGQSAYLTGHYGIVENNRIVSTIKHEEWMLRKAESELVPEVLSMQHKEQSLLHKQRANWEQRFYARSTWAQRHHFGPGPESGYLASRRGLLNLVKESGDPLTDQELLSLLKQKHTFSAGRRSKLFNLFPSPSPTTLAHDVFSMADPRQGYVVPEAVSFGRRPLQHVRPDYSLTSESRAALASRRGEFDWIFGKKTGSEHGALLKTLYVSSRHDPALTRWGVSSAGMSAVSSSAQPFLGRVQHLQFDIDAARVAEGFRERGLESFVGRTVEAGTAIGYSPQGELIRAQSNMTIKRALPFRDRLKGSFIGVEAEVASSDIELNKLFGSSKTLARGQDPKMIRSIASQVGVSNLAGLGEIEMITFMDDMRKNKGLFYEQLFSSLQEFTKQNMSGNKQSSTLISNFAKDPSYIARLGSDQERLLESFKIARAAKFTPKQMGLTFGAVPDVFGIKGETPQALRESWLKYMMGASGKDEGFINRALGVPVSEGFWKHKLGISLPEAGWISKGVAAGMGQFFHGGGTAAGTGFRATYEPRAFELLGSGHLGKLGLDVRDELLGRLSTQYGEKTTAQELLASSLASIHEAAQGRGTAHPGAIAASAVKEEMYQTGFHLKTGASSVYVPPSDFIQALRPHVLSQQAGLGEQTRIDKRLGIAYKNLVEGVKTAGSEGDILDVLEAARSDVGAATFGTIGGKGSAAGGRMPGSLFLTPTLSPNLGMADEFNYKAPPMDKLTVGVPSSQMQKMFADMEELHGKEAMKEIRSRYSRGGKVAGILGRHPYIDQYSNMPVWIKEIPGDLPEVTIPERAYSSIAAPGQLTGEEFQSFSRQAKLMQAQGRAMDTIRLGPALGLATDFDADLASVTLVSPQLEQRLGARLAKDQISQQIYEDYAIRLQYMKSKAAGELGLSLEQALPAEVMKLRTTKTKLGAISEALGAGRFSVLASQSRFSAQESANAMSLLTYLEQGPISAKHVKASEVEGFLGGMEDLRQAMYRKDPSVVARLSREIIGQNPLGQATLEGGFTHARWAPGMKDPVIRQISGIDIDKAARTITESIHYASEPGELGVSPLRMRELMRDKGRPPTAQETEILLSNRTTFPHGYIKNTSISKETMDIVADRMGSASAREYVMPPGSPGRGAAEAKNFLSEANKRAASGQGMSLTKKVGLGVAGAIALAGILSRPRETIGPEQVAPPQPKLTGSSGGAYMKPDDLFAPQKPVTQLTAPTLETTGNTARLMPNRGQQWTIRAQSQSRTDYGELNRNLGRMVGGQSVVNSRVNDNRRSLNAQRLSELMEKE